MKMITAKDMRTGNDLNITYNPSNSSYTINNIHVERKTAHEDSDNELVFAADGVSVLFHVSRKQIEWLHSLRDDTP